MKNHKKSFLVLTIVIAFVGTVLFLPKLIGAGDLEPPAGPDDAASAMYTHEDLYNRLDTGATGTKRTGGFTEPSSAPGPTGYTTDEIMEKMPQQDNTEGAEPSDVVAGKTFFGINTSQWGTTAGTMKYQGAITITPGTTDQSITEGYHNGSGKVSGDSDLIAENIMYGKIIFGVEGNGNFGGGSGESCNSSVDCGQNMNCVYAVRVLGQGCDWWPLPHDEFRCTDGTWVIQTIECFQGPYGGIWRVRVGDQWNSTEYYDATSTPPRSIKVRP